MEQQNRPVPPDAARRMNRSQREARRRRRRLRIVRNWALFLAACGCVMALMTSGILWLLPRAHALIAGPEAFEARTYDGADYRFDGTDPRLVLVNNNLSLAQEPQPGLSVADDATGQQLEAEAAEAYRRMAAAAQADGIGLVLVTGWQDAAARQAAFDAQQQLYLKKGYSAQDAAAHARTIVPEPECNELATGYGAEILSEDYTTRDTGFARTRAYEWLSAYAAEYGFILRWPEDRQAATGMVFEPWHWRYVGPENALAIRASGYSLEEFLALERMK